MPKSDKYLAFFNEIVAQHQGILHKVARTYCPLEDERQDLLQEMLIQIWRALPKYNPQFKISTWLYRIALNVAISYYRKNAARLVRFTKLDAPVPNPETEEKTTIEQQLNLLEQFIYELKEIDKALMLLYLEDKSYAEIADILGISASNVGTKVTRIKNQLKTRFSQLNEHITTWKN